MHGEISKLIKGSEEGKISRRDFLHYAGLLCVSLVYAQALLFGVPQTSAAAKKAPTSTTEKVTLHWYNPHGAPTFLPHWEKIISEFEAAHPRIKISSDIVGWSDLLTKLQADAVAGTLPDMTTLGLEGVLGFHATGVTVETDPVIRALKSDGVISNPSLLKQVEFNGKHYGVPRYMVFTGITYRKDWFEEAGIELAGTQDKLQYTWDEYADICEKLYNPPERYAFAAPWGAIDGAKQMWNFFLGNGITVLNKDGTLNWDKKKIKETYEFIIDMVQKYSTPGSVSYTLDDVNIVFSRGNVAMAWGDGDVHLELNENPPDWMKGGPEAHLGFMPHPYKSTPKRGMHTSNVGFILFDAGHIQETYEWVRFFMQDDNLIESIWPYRVLVTPATFTAQKSKKFTEDPVVIAWKPVLDQMALAAREIPGYPVASFWGPKAVSQTIYWSGIFDGVVQKVLAGDASLDDALADAKRRLEDIIKG